MSLDFKLKMEIPTLYTRNITHNLTDMAYAAGIYQALWRGGQYEKAEDIIQILEDGLHKLKLHPEKYKKYDSPNGWGKYEHFVPFVEDVLNACKKYPLAVIESDV